MNKAKAARQKLPTGWTAKQVRELAQYSDNLTEDEQAVEIEAGLAKAGHTVIVVPTEFVPEIRKLISRKHDPAMLAQLPQVGASNPSLFDLCEFNRWKFNRLPIDDRCGKPKRELFWACVCKTQCADVVVLIHGVSRRCRRILRAGRSPIDFRVVSHACA